MNWKWLWVILLAIIGILAAIAAIEYLAVSIHQLPSWIPGHKNIKGHYHKRGALAAVIAVVALGAAGYLTYRFTRGQGSGAAGGVTPTTTPATTPSSADDLLTSPPRDLGATPDE
jgi:uncharacterized membrane protein YidH (DUF202 family)